MPATNTDLENADSHDVIQVRGARENNLAGISVDIRPDVDSLRNLSAAIIVDQERIGANARSTVGTATDAHTMLRILFSRLGTPRVGPPSAFSFNRAEGMCPACEGLGKASEIDLDEFVDAADRISAYGGRGWQVTDMTRAELTPQVFNVTIQVTGPTGKQEWREGIGWSDGHWTMARCTVPMPALPPGHRAEASAPGPCGRSVSSSSGDRPTTGLLGFRSAGYRRAGGGALSGGRHRPPLRGRPRAPDRPARHP